MFKFNGELVREAHRLTRGIKAEYPEVTYSFQFGLNMKYLLSNIKGVEKIMVELKGSEKQIKWAEDIRKDFNLWIENMMTNDKFYMKNFDHRTTAVVRKSMNKVRDYIFDNCDEASYWIKWRNALNFIYGDNVLKARKEYHLEDGFEEYDNSTLF